MIIRVKELIWDEYNSSHITKHSVSIGEVEQVCSGKAIAQPSYSNRISVIGKTKKGHMLTIVLAEKNKGIYYPITARDTSRKERGWIKYGQN